MPDAPGVAWPRLAGELLAIVFGVLLALVLDDWRQGRNEDALRDAAMLSIRAELERNQLAIEARIPYHEAMLDTLTRRIDARRAGAADPAPAVLPSLARLGFEHGLGGVALAAGAWEAARAAGTLTRIGVDELFLLSAAYSTQRDVDAAFGRLEAAHGRYVLGSIEPDHAVAGLVDLGTSMGDLVDREHSLCDSYRTLTGRLYPPSLPDTAGPCGSGNVQIR